MTVAIESEIVRRIGHLNYASKSSEQDLEQPEYEQLDRY